MDPWDDTWVGFDGDPFEDDDAWYVGLGKWFAETFDVSVSVDAPEFAFPGGTGRVSREGVQFSPDPYGATTVPVWFVPAAIAVGAVLIMKN